MIKEKGEQVGIVSIDDALRIAKESSLDLVEVSPGRDDEPPVCRIMDYGRFRYQRKVSNKRQRQNKVQIKEIKLRPVTEEGDFLVKLRNATRFLERGDKVKITLRFRGREVLHQNLGAELLERFKLALNEIAGVEQEPRLEGRQMIMVIAPKRK